MQKTSTEVEVEPNTEENPQMVLEKGEIQRNNLWGIVIISIIIMATLGVIIFRIIKRKK